MAHVESERIAYHTYGTTGTYSGQPIYHYKTKPEQKDLPHNDTENNDKNEVTNYFFLHEYFKIHIIKRFR